MMDTTLKIEETEERKYLQDKSEVKRKSFIFFILIALIGFVITDYCRNQHIQHCVNELLDWMEENLVLGIAVFTLVYAIATILFIPGSLLTLGSGYVFANAFGMTLGIPLATLAVFIGASSGAIVSFLLSRYLFRVYVQEFSKNYAIFEAVDVALREKGFIVILLLRLSPIIPFNVLDYLAGITSISLSSYAWAMIAILPGTVFYVFLGASASNLADHDDSNHVARKLSFGFGLFFGLLGIMALSHYSKKELSKIIERQDERNAGAADNLMESEVSETMAMC